MNECNTAEQVDEKNSEATKEVGPNFDGEIFPDAAVSDGVDEVTLQRGGEGTPVFSKMSASLISTSSFCGNVLIPRCFFRTNTLHGKK